MKTYKEHDTNYTLHRGEQSPKRLREFKIIKIISQKSHQKANWSSEGAEKIQAGHGTILPTIFDLTFNFHVEKNKIEKFKSFRIITNEKLSIFAFIMHCDAWLQP